MRTSAGLWDALFGERVTLEIPSPEGAVKKVQVTKKWLEKMAREGKAERVSPSSQAGSADALLERAENLVQAAKINAASMFAVLLARFTVLRGVDVRHSTFVLTVASVFMAATRLNNLRLGNDREERLMDTVAQRLARWRPHAIRGFDDCKALFEQEFDRLTQARHEPRFVASDAVGLWIAWNILGRAPQTADECMLVRATGGMVTQTFFEWWDR